jgi:CheY-like chemotaxis protein
MTTSVLVVDDSKLARIVVGKAISALQPEWRRLEAANAEEALALFESEAIDVVVLDFNMPGINGLELAEQLRARYPELPIALATANIQDEIISRAKAANVTFVPKPITEDGMRGFISGAALQMRARA